MGSHRAGIRGHGGGRWQASRGGRGLGGARGASRGRVRRGQNRFDSSRLAEQDSESQEGQESDTEVSNEEEADLEDSDFESETDKNNKMAYRALLDSFSKQSSSPASKRRKLDGADDVRLEKPYVSAAPKESDDNDDDNGIKIQDIEDGNSDAGENEANEDGSSDGEKWETKDLDFVEEDEEDQTAELSGSDIDEQLDTTDPFETHFSAPDAAEVARRVSAIQNEAWTTTKNVVNASKQIFNLPQTNNTSTRFALPPSTVGLDSLKLKRRLADGLAISKSPALDPVEQMVAPLIFNYYDTLFCERTPDNGDSLRRIASLHAVNHIFKTRDRVLKNNEKLAKAAHKCQKTDVDRGRLGDEEDVEFRDQGFTRPKVLMLLPTRAACVRMVDTICALCQPEQQENRKRFDDAYVDKDAVVGADRPADFRDLFDGNDDDMFRLGLKFTRKTIKYFAQFYNADIILASPLGLRMAMGSEDRLAETARARRMKRGQKAQTDVDFLSSIELVLLDQADALLMQNWEHVEHIFAHLNQRPRDSSHAFDISRLRPWYLDEQATFYRQTIAFSAFHTPVLAELFRRFGHNWAGRVRVQPAALPGVVGRIGVRGVKQTFSRFASPTIAADPDARFDYFVKAVVPALVGKSKGDSQRGGILIFIPSYLDFVRVRNWFATAAAAANITFGTVSEYASVTEASRAMSYFLTGRHRVLLYTERAHHFRRHQLNGVRTVVLYGLPENPIFYTEMTGGYLTRSQRSQRLEPGQGSVRALFSQWDVFKLERVVGSQRVGPMLRERSDTFVFEEER